MSCFFCLLLVRSAGCFMRWDFDSRASIQRRINLVCFLFLCANICLTYGFARRLTGSREVAALACLLHAYHGSSAGLAYNSGTCFDTFCFFFYMGALTYYISIRRRGGSPRLWQIALLLCLYVAALDAKEMAVTLPVILGCTSCSTTARRAGDRVRSRSAPWASSPRRTSSGPHTEKKAL